MPNQRQEIADELGLSKGTVDSFYANEDRKKTVSAKNRIRILQCAPKIGYQPRKAQQRNPLGHDRWPRKRIVGYQIPRQWDIDGIDNVVFARTFAALQSELEKAGMQLQLFSLADQAPDDSWERYERELAKLEAADRQPNHFDPDPIGSAVLRARVESGRALIKETEGLYQKKIDAFIFNDPSRDDIRIRHAQDSGIPYVVMGLPVATPPRVDSAGRLSRPSYAAQWPVVDIDDRTGFADLLMLLKLGRKHKNVLHIGFDDDATFPGPRRALGIREASHFAPPLPESETVHYNTPAKLAVERIQRQLLDHPAATAVLCDCDRYAFHTLLAVQANDRRFGTNRAETLDVVGFDDDGTRRAWPTPWLSMAHPSVEWAQQVVATLQDQMSSPLPHPVTETLIKRHIVGLTQADREAINEGKVSLKCPLANDPSGSPL